MTRDAEHVFDAVQGHPPSDEFRARLRADYLAAAAERGHPPDRVGNASDGVLVELHATDDDGVPSQRARRSRRGRFLAAAAVALIASLGVAVVVDRTSDPEDVATTPEPADPAVPLTASRLLFEAGTYRVDTLGTPFTFRVGDTAGVDTNENGVVTIVDFPTPGAQERTITLWRTPVLPAPSAPTAPPTAATGWPAGDLDGWVRALGDDAAPQDPANVEFGGLAAESVDVRLECPEGECPAFSSNGALTPLVADGRYRVVVVDQGTEDPIVVLVALDPDGSLPAFAASVLSSLRFGAVAPSPVSITGTAMVDLDVSGGISVDVGVGTTVVEPYPGFARILPPGIDGDIEFLTRPLDTEGDEVTSIDRLLQLLADEAVELTPIPTSAPDGVEGRGFAVESGGTPNVVLKTREADLARSEYGWEPAIFGFLWVFDHPTRGLLVVSAESQNQDDALGDWADALVRSIEFS